MKLTLAITTYERKELTLASFAKVVDDPRIDEILIVDDCSEFNLFIALGNACREWPKVKLIRQGRNRGMATNKKDAVGFSRNEWVILLDSDNEIDSKYLDAIPDQLDENVIYCPCFAKPNFDMTSLSGKTIDKNTAKLYINEEAFSWHINTCNYILNKEQYLKHWKFDPSIKGIDTAFFASQWLAAGNSFYIMPNCHYNHLVHDGSEFMKHVDYNMKMAKEILTKIKSL